MQENNTAEDQTILVVDDDIEIRTELVAFFNRYGHSAKAAYSGSEARNIISKSTIAIAIVDVVMPEENGLELTKWIVNNTEIAVILLTSLDSPYEKIVGLELGADDYVTKPFEPRELLARVRSVLRRKKEPSPPLNQFYESNNEDKFYLDERNGILKHPTLGNHQLSFGEFNILCLLKKSEGQAVSKDVLTREVYKREWNTEDRLVDNIISKLRKKLNSAGSEAAIITVRNRGYILQQGFFNQSE